MKIYTKNGDRGFTNAGNGRKVSKNAKIIKCYGALDELNSHIGELMASIDYETEKSDRAIKIDTIDLVTNDILKSIQETLFSIGASIVSESQCENIPIEAIESYIDKIENVLPRLENFILPGGVISAAKSHVCRTICRRCEIEYIEYLTEREPLGEYRILKYLNRLSDLFFVMARFQNYKNNINDIIWRSQT